MQKTKKDKQFRYSEFYRSDHLIRLLKAVDENLTRSSRVHEEFLRLQEQNLDVISAAFGLRGNPASESRQSSSVVISKSQLAEFGTGSIARCFGPEYAPLDQRKSPRIPNGDLLMIDRVMSISGRRGELNPPASIMTELDINADAWFIKENGYSGIPLGILLEIALQPCGILSAYLGTSLLLPAEVNLFRNLDGEIRIHAPFFLAGKTVVAEAELLSSVTAGGMTIQSYSFRVSCQGNLVAEGQSSFGYFTSAVMSKQSGLVMPENSHSYFADAEKVNGKRITLFNFSTDEPPQSRQNYLNLVDKVEFIELGGRYGHGLILGEKRLDGREWFFKNHFFQDPVMPGSLGLEAVIQGMYFLLKNMQVNRQSRLPLVSFSGNKSFAWKYRGQVTPASRLLQFETHLKLPDSTRGDTSLSCDAEFWVDGVRIYAFRDIRMSLEKGVQT